MTKIRSKSAGPNSQPPSCVVDVIIVIYSQNYIYDNKLYSKKPYNTQCESFKDKQKRHDHHLNYQISHALEGFSNAVKVARAASQ